MRALRGESAFSFYPRGVCSPAEFPSRKGGGGVGGTRSGGRLSRSSGRTAGAVGSGGNYRKAERAYPGAVGERRTRWARGARKAGGLPS